MFLPVELLGRTGRALRHCRTWRSPRGSSCRWCRSTTSRRCCSSRSTSAPASACTSIVARSWKRGTSNSRSAACASASAVRCSSRASHWGWRSRRSVRRWPRRRRPTRPPCSEAMGDRYVGPASFEKSVEVARKDPLLHPVERRTMWVPRDKQRKKIDANAGPIAMFIANLVGGIVKYALWIVVGLLIGLLAWTFRSLVALVAFDGAATPRRTFRDRHRADRPRRSLARRRRRRGARVVDAGPRAPRARAAVSRERREHGGRAPARRSCRARRKPNACALRARSARPKTATPSRASCAPGSTPPMPIACRHRPNSNRCCRLASTRFGWAA